MPIKFANNAETTLSSAVSTSATSIPVVDASVFPSITGSDYFLATLVDSGDNTEIVKVTAVSSNTLTVTRAREGTAARSFQSGDKVENRLTAGGLTDLNTRTDVDVDTMTGDGSTTTLTLSTAPASEDNTQVYLDGVYQNKSTYSVSGTTLTFSTAPPNNVAVEVIIITPAAGTFSSSDYATSSQGNKADNALPRSGGAMTGPITTSSTFDGRDVSADGAKLDGIEAGATADQTASEIKTAYESNSDTNAFTDSEKTKLTNIEANATADQSDEEIQDIVGAMVSGNTESGIAVTYDDTSGKLNFSVASQTDENFTSADHSKLDAIEPGATADQTDEEIQDIVGAMVSGNTESGITVTYDDTGGKLNFSVASQTDENFTSADHTKLDGIESGATADQTASEIRALVESATDSNVFTDADHSKLDGIETSADVTDTANVVSALTAGNNINIASDGTISTSTTQAINASSLGASADNTVDIGTSSSRFKDIYLSNGVKFGSQDALVTSNSSTYLKSGADLFFQPNNTQSMKLTSSKNLYLGTTSDSPSNGGMRFEAGSIGFMLISHPSSVSSGNWYHAFKHGGSVIGTIAQSGTNGVSYNTTSDQRLKTNIQDAEEAGSRIDAIQVRQFDWKSDGLHQDFGMIAQELYEVAPDAVTKGKTEDDMMSVDYSKLVPMLVKEIQSLRQRIETLETN